MEIKNGFVVRNDISWAGFRRLHVMANENQTIDRAAVDQMIQDEGGRIEGEFSWHDENLGAYHLYIVWRITMATYPMFVSVIDRNERRAKKKKSAMELISEAISRAAVNYHLRFERWPDRAMIRSEEMEKIENYNGQEYQIQGEPIKGQLIRVEIEPVKINWQMGIVGVYIDEKKSRSQTVEV